MYVLSLRADDDLDPLVVAEGGHDERGLSAELQPLLGLVVSLNITSKRRKERPLRGFPTIGLTSRILMNFFLSDS